MKVKGQSVHHRLGGLKEQSLIQLDYAYTRSSIPTNKKWQVHTILTCVETTTGLCMAVPTSRKGPTRHQLTQLKKFGNSPKDGTHTPHARREAYVRSCIVLGRVNPNPGLVPRPVRYLGIVGRVYTRGV
eukprot:3809181-Amphidinium_carterae.2